MKIKTWSDYKLYRKTDSRLNEEVEKFLISQLQTHRDKVILEFCDIYNPIIKSIVKKYLWSNVSAEDLYSSGREGLIISIDNFLPEKNFRFGTFATHYILGGIRRVIDQTNNTIKKPSHVNRIIHKINLLSDNDDAIEKLIEQGFTKEQILNALVAKEIKMTDLDDAIEIQTNDHYEIFDNANLKTALKKLSPKESAAIVLKFGLFDVRLHTYKEMDKIFFCDTELWMKKLLGKLKELLENEPN